MNKYIVIFLILFFKIGLAQTCTGKFINPITDIAWQGIFPITFGSVLKVGNGLDTPNPGSPVCICPPTNTVPIPRVGLTLGFWEPARLIDVTKVPGCFVNLGGMKIDIGDLGRGHIQSKNSQRANETFHVHYYIYPLLIWLNILTDIICLDENDFDIAYVTELDPLWQDDELTFLINPEALIFGNPLAQAACSVDCVTTSANLPLDPLFWCAGCQGSLYPMNGRVSASNGGIGASLLVAERMIAKLHREAIAWGTWGGGAMCARLPQPIIQKSAYKFQLANPSSLTNGTFAVNPFGRSTVVYESGRELPITGENFGWMMFRKRNCCAF